MPTDSELRVHRDWINTLQPVGLVVSAPALAAAQAFPDKSILREQQVLESILRVDGARRPAGGGVHGRAVVVLDDFPAFAREVLGLKPAKLTGAPGGPPLPESLSVPLPEFGETLAPTYAVPALKEQLTTATFREPRSWPASRRSFFAGSCRGTAST